MGDVGQTADSAATMQHLLASAPQSVLDVGDISCAPAACAPVQLAQCSLRMGAKHSC